MNTCCESHTRHCLHGFISFIKWNNQGKAAQTQGKKINVPRADSEPLPTLSYSPTLIFRIRFSVYSRYNVRPLPCKFAHTVMDSVKVASGSTETEMATVTRPKQDQCKAAILTDTGFIHSGQRAREDKWDTSSWITVICFGTHKPLPQ